jgi:hypothetical protein
LDKANPPNTLLMALPRASGVVKNATTDKVVGVTTALATANTTREMSTTV